MVKKAKWVTPALATLLCLQCGIAPLAAAQETQEPTVRVTTRLVVINVIVQDKKGAPIEGLTRDDFALFDEGEQQAISLFSVETLGASGESPALPPDTFSNRIETTSGGQKNVTVILLDFLNTSWQDRAYARDQVIKFLGQLRPDDRVALYALGKKLSILHNFTSDARPLLRALNRHQNTDRTHVDASIPDTADTGDPEIDAQLDEQFQNMADFFVQDRASRTADAMVAIANHLAPFPGRKSLVWVSSAFPISIGMDEMILGSTRNRQTLTRYVEKAVLALNNANIAIYPVDARGLVVGMAFPSRPISRRAPPTPLIQTRALTLSHDTMNTLADRTGGRASYNSNDIQGAIRRAIDDSRVSYVLGYYPSHGKWDGKFRRIRVKVRREGARTRSRAGYFTDLPSPRLSAPDREAALREEVGRPLRSSGVGMTVSVESIRMGGATAIRLTLEIDGNHLSFDEREGRWIGLVDLMFGQVRNEGQTVRSETQNVELDLNRGQFELATGRGFRLTKLIELLPDAEELIVVARDVPTGNTGSVSFRLGRYLETPALPDHCF